MMLPFGLDSVIEMIARGLAAATGWRPIGKRVSLTHMEGPPGVFGTNLTGRVEQLIEGGLRSDQPPGILVKLDQPWSSAAIGVKTIDKVSLFRRFGGHGPMRLLLTSALMDGYDATRRPSPESMINSFQVRRLPE